jgi:hypothetical protein
MIIQTDTMYDKDVIKDFKLPVEPCEVVADVHFAHDSSIVAILDKSTLKCLMMSAKSFKILLQKDLVKKGITSVPVYEYGCSSREKLSLQPRFKLVAEDDKKTKKLKAELKKLEEGNIDS